MIEITNEMVLKIQSIGKISEQITLECEQGRLRFIADNQKSYEECDIEDSVCAFKSLFYAHKLVPFFTNTNKFNVVSHGAGTPIIFAGDGYMALMTNHV
jgi:hypothetical protein